MTMLILLSIVPEVVFAKTYYTSYSDWIETDEKVVDTELQEGKIEYLYRFYQKEKVYTDDYYRNGDNPKEFPFRSNQKRKTNFSNWQEEHPEKLEGRIIETKKMYRYQELEKISRLILTDISGSNDCLSLTEIEVYNGKEKIPITLECDTCSNEVLSGFTNEKISERPNFLYPDQELKIELDKEYNPKDLEVHLYVSDLIGEKPTSFSLKSFNQNQQEYILIKRKYHTFSTLGEYYRDVMKLGDFISTKYFDQMVFETDNKIEENPWIHILKPVTYYRYQDTEYLYYRFNRIYLDGFYSSCSDYIQDENHVKPIFYQRTRDKVVVKDSVELTSKQFAIDDVIVSSTIPKEHFNIHHNIDWNVEGSYQINLSYQDLKITIPVTYFFQNEEILTTTQTKSVRNKQNKVIKRVALSEKNEKKQESNSKNKKNIILIFLFFLGVCLIVYSIEKIVDRKK